MQKLFRCLLFAVATVGVASLAAAGELTVTIANGRATVIARDVPVRQILAEWARVGNTRIVNAEKLMGAPISLELVDVPEKEALDILLRSAAGYMAAPRSVVSAGASQYDRVVILPTSRAPAATASVPAPFNASRPALNLPQPPQPPPDDQDGEPGDQGPVPPPGMQGPIPPPGMPTPGMPFPPPGMPQPNAVPNQGPVTAPRPGMLPTQPQPQQPNPYAPGGRGAPGRPGGEGGQ